MALEDLVKDVRVLAIVCNQYGDSGKGKYSDYFAANWADVIARGTGGANAGHTVVIDGKEMIFHLIPAGITYDKLGKINIVGNGTVIDPRKMVKEMDELDKAGIAYNHLMISQDAHVVLPCQIGLDLDKDATGKKGGVGSTGNGIGPCYTDKVARRGVMIRELYNDDVLKAKLEKLKDAYPGLNVAETVEFLHPYADRMKPFVRDTVTELHKMLEQGKKVCLEGAQGLLLSIEHGTYPFLTSSDCSINGTASGCGLSAKAVDLVLGVVKFPYMTRVGNGPFPTELGGLKSDEYCACDAKTRNRQTELERWDIPFEMVGKKPKYDFTDYRIVGLMNSPDDFERGVGLRLAGNCFGASTGRLRRTGWTDAVACRYAVRINGPMKLILTKLDVVRGMTGFKICYGYNHPDGSLTDEFTKDAAALRRVEPLYADYSGSDAPILGETEYDRLPFGMQEAIADFEKFVGAPAAIISTGPDQKHNIVR
jgi:adenylosuccinate synthase